MPYSLHEEMKLSVIDSDLLYKCVFWGRIGCIYEINLPCIPTTIWSLSLGHLRISSKWTIRIKYKIVQTQRQEEKTTEEGKWRTKEHCFWNGTAVRFSEIFYFSKLFLEFLILVERTSYHRALLFIPSSTTSWQLKDWNMNNVSMWYQKNRIPQLSIFCLIQGINNYVQINTFWRYIVRIMANNILLLASKICSCFLWLMAFYEIGTEKI
jgi:hypothetical protein